MIGYILAAGFGTRLQPLTNHIPKALVPVCGVSILERNLQSLSKQGIDSIGVNTHYKSEQLISFQKTASVSFSLFEERDKIRGTAGPLYDARDFLSQDALFCVQNVDIISSAVVSEIARNTEMGTSVGLLICSPNPKSGTILYNPETMCFQGISGSAKNFAEGLERADFIGLSVYKREFLQFLDKNDFSITDVWNRLLFQGISISVAVVKDIWWFDIGTPNSLGRIHFDFLKKKISLSTPTDQLIDHDRRLGIPITLPSEIISGWGFDVWSDSCRIDPECFLEKCVVLCDTKITRGTTKQDLIITPWGEMSIG